MDQAARDRAQQQYGGLYVAWLGDEVFLSAETYDELRDGLAKRAIDQIALVIELVPRSDVVYIW